MVAQTTSRIPGSGEGGRMCFVRVPPAFERHACRTIEPITDLEILGALVDELEIKIEVVVAWWLVVLIFPG